MEAFNADRHFFERNERRGVSFLLALAVHGLLAVFLLVSVQWHTQRAGTVSVELWGSPPPAPVAVQKPKPEPKIEPKPAPQPVPKPEPIPEKKPEIVEEKVKKVAKQEEKPKPQPASIVKAIEKPKPKLEVKPEPKKLAEKKPEPKKTESGLAALLGQAMEQRNQATTQTGEKPGGTGTNVNAKINAVPGLGAGGGGRLGDAYLGQVVRLIKSNMVYPDNKPDNPKARIKVFLLPDGTIRDAQLLRAVGDPTYAEAARRAILTTRMFPPRPDGKSFTGDLREWNLSFCAKETDSCKID